MFRGTVPDPARRCRLEHEAAEQHSLQDIQRLPALASEYFSDQHESFAWTDTLRTILEGVLDNDRGAGPGPNSPLSILCGHEQTLVRNIYSFLAHEHDRHVKLTIPGACVNRSFFGEPYLRCIDPDALNRQDYYSGRGELYADCNLPEVSTSPNDYVSFASCGTIKFPPPNNRNVNMMPFIYGDESSLPPDLRCYQECIDECPINECDGEVGKVYYLTVHETYVHPEKAQRREGLHIEAPGTILEENAPAFQSGQEPHRWGWGESPDIFKGGIYMASSVANTSRIYDAIVDNSIPGITDRHGGCEGLRGIIGEPTDLKAGELIWMTDRTPHEALPQEIAGMRQFFRVVTSDVSHWYAKHSTPNPKVPLPENVIVVDEDKFV